MKWHRVMAVALTFLGVGFVGVADGLLYFSAKQIDANYIAIVLLSCLGIGVTLAAVVAYGEMIKSLWNER